MSDEEGVCSSSSSRNVGMAAAFTAAPAAAGAPYPQEVVEPGQGLDEQIGPLVGKLITSSNEEEEGLVQVEVQVTVRQDRHLQPTLVPRKGGKDVKTTHP